MLKQKTNYWFRRNVLRFLSVAVFISTSTAHAGLILNGSFEQNSASYDPSYLYAPDMSRYGGGPSAQFGTVAGWDFTLESPDLVRDAFHPQATSGKYNAYDGLFFVHMITYQGYTEGVSSVFNTTVGQNYTVTFAYAQGGLWLDPTNGWKFIGTQDAGIDVSLTDSVSSSVAYAGSFVAPTTTFNAANTPTPLAWLPGSFTFAGTGNPITMQFTANRLDNSFVNLYLDDVSVSAVPEPGTAFFGILSIAVVMLRRNRNRRSA